MNELANKKYIKFIIDIGIAEYPLWQKELFRDRFLDKLSLKELGIKYKLSMSQCGRIYKKLLNKLKKDKLVKWICKNYIK